MQADTHSVIHPCCLFFCLIVPQVSDLAMHQNTRLPLVLAVAGTNTHVAACALPAAETPSGHLQHQPMTDASVHPFPDSLVCSCIHHSMCSTRISYAQLPVPGPVWSISPPTIPCLDTFCIGLVTEPWVSQALQLLLAVVVGRIRMCCPCVDWQSPCQAGQHTLMLHGS